MAKLYLATKLPAEVEECNALPYGYPSRGAPLAGGVVEEEVGGAGWTVRQFPEEETGTGTTVVEVDSEKLPPATESKLRSKLTEAKPKTKEPKELKNAKAL